jgi:hypothetical protein
MGALSQSNGGVGPPLWRNHKWAFAYTDPSGSFASAEVDVYLDKIGATTPTRVTLTDASTGVSRTATTVTVSQEPSWVNTNLSAGTWMVWLLIDKSRVAWWQFEVLTPEAGDQTP